MTKSGRYETTTQRVETKFGSVYIHIDHLSNGMPDGAWISWGSKDPESAIVGLISALSEGLNKALKNG
jgi:hypothetical protein